MNKKTRELVWNKYNKHCAYCGSKIELKDMQVDHIKPLARGQPPALRKMMGIEVGNDNIENYNPSCRACNFRKGMLTIEEFREVIVKGMDVLEKNFTYRLMRKYMLIAEVSPRKVEFFFERVKRNQLFLEL